MRELAQAAPPGHNHRQRGHHLQPGPDAGVHLRPARHPLRNPGRRIGLGHARRIGGAARQPRQAGAGGGGRRAQSLYTVQALWTAARYNIPVGLRHLQQTAPTASSRSTWTPTCATCSTTGSGRANTSGMDFASPLDLAAIAQAMGVASEKVEDAAAIGPALEKAFASGKPYLLDVSIDGSL